MAKSTQKRTRLRVDRVENATTTFSALRDFHELLSLLGIRGIYWQMEFPEYIIATNRLDAMYVRSKHDT